MPPINRKSNGNARTRVERLTRHDGGDARDAAGEEGVQRGHHGTGLVPPVVELQLRGGELVH